MTRTGIDAIAATITERLLALPNVVAVYPRRNSATGVVSGLVALATGSAPPSLVSIAEQGGTIVVEATIGISDEHPARDVARQAYELALATLDELGTVDRRVIVRIATVD